jgi:hypothetical protein
VTLPASFQRLLPFAAVALAVLAAVLLVARGLGGGSTASAQQVLDRALKEEARSGEFNAHVNFGLDDGGTPTTLVNSVVTGAGAATAAGKPAPQRLHFSDQIAGKDPISLDELSTGERGYIQVDGQWYLLSDAQYKRVFTPGKSRSFVEALGFDPRRWMRDPKLETSARVGGVEVSHVSGAVDADAALTDLGFYKGATTTATKGVVAAIKSSAKHGTMDVLVGKQDGILRKISVTAQTDPVKGGPQVRSTLRFAIGLDKVNQPVKVVEPKGALAPSLIATIPRAKLGDEADDILGVPTKSSGTGGTARKRHKAAAPTHRKSRQGQKSYVSCVQSAQDLAALDRCQTLLP